MIFEIHQIMLTDSDFTGAIENYIANNHVNAEYSVSIISKQFADRFRNMDNPYMQERSADIIDISERLIGILSGSEYKAASHGKVIIAAEDLLRAKPHLLTATMCLGL